MISKLRQYIWGQQYNPDIIGIFVNPYYIARKGLFENIAGLAVYITGKTLDVGCGQRPYEQLFKSSEYIGLEIDTVMNRLTKKADFYYDGGRFPFVDKEYDSVVINQVFEHVFIPEKFLREVNRVLKVDGMCLLTVPFVWDEHEQPHDFARYTSFGIRTILENHGFAMMEQRKSVNDIRIVFQMINAYIYKKTYSKNKWLNFLAVLVLMAPFSIIGEVLVKGLPKNDDLYLDNVVLAKKVHDV